MSRLERLKTLAPRRAWLILGAAVAVGLLAALGASSYLAARMAAIEAKGKVPTVNLVVAKRELRRGDRLSADTVAVRPFPADYSPSEALHPADQDRFEGQTIAATLRPGDAVLWSMLEGRKAAPLAGKVELGRRAITLSVDEVSSIAGLLEPGDTVDLLLTVDHKGHKYTWPVQQGMRVLATGSRAIEEVRPGERRQFSTVTLDASPREAQRIVLAREVGKLTALLRNGSDATSVASRPSDLAGLVGVKSQTLGELLSGAKQVPVMYGGRGAAIPLEALELGRGLALSPGAQSRTSLAAESGSAASVISAVPAAAMSLPVNR